VYELFNLENFKEFDAAYNKALEGKLDADAYATECAKLEYIALKKAKKFFEDHPLPNAIPGRNSKYDQLREVPQTFEEYMSQYIDSSGRLHHPGQFFKEYYEQEMAPYVDNKSRSEQQGGEP
jgi:hypothetical protein